jgi:hypothetical protein
LEQVAPESRNLPQQRCALCHCFVDLDQPGHLETACLLPAPQTAAIFVIMASEEEQSAQLA